ncbi:MAG: diacylglycerol kinase family protein [Ruminococcaceae bacterium]|nr:diacylglycerol kinase family protein [Oscillospiraceae bacterium]
MNYFLYNPKSNNENNDLNIITENGQNDCQVAMKICLLDLDIAQFATQLSQDDRVFICGGDGTLHYFANNSWGIDFPCPLYVIRSGTGNDFLNDIGQKDNSTFIDIREYLKDLPEGEINGKKRRFLNGIGFGLDGEVCLGVEQYKQKHPKKKANYATIAVKQLLFTYKGPRVKVTVDGVSKEYDDVWAVSTMKGKYYGGGLMIAPTQERSSGKLSVMVMHGGARLKALSLFAGLSKGSHIKCQRIVEIIEGDDVRVEADRPSTLQIDGEVYLDVTSYAAKTRAALEAQDVSEGAEDAVFSN